jgi:hypothetical protein
VDALTANRTSGIPGAVVALIELDIIERVPQMRVNFTRSSAQRLQRTIEVDGSSCSASFHKFRSRTKSCCAKRGDKPPEDRVGCPLQSDLDDPAHLPQPGNVRRGSKFALDGIIGKLVSAVADEHGIVLTLDKFNEMHDRSV